VPTAANSYSGQNYGKYCNPALDKLFSQELATTDPNARQQVFNQEHQIYLTDFPFVTLYSPIDVAVAKDNVHNYLPGPMGASETINVWKWWCDGGKC
jgi:peptide/nickel transport system substrate-binding protein